MRQSSMVPQHRSFTSPHLSAPTGVCEASRARSERLSEGLTSYPISPMFYTDWRLPLQGGRCQKLKLQTFLPSSSQPTC
jgi:hypothetical protein